MPTVRLRLDRGEAEVSGALAVSGQREPRRIGAVTLDFVGSHRAYLVGLSTRSRDPPDCPRSVVFVAAKQYAAAVLRPGGLTQATKDVHRAGL